MAIISRLQLTHPALGDAGGSALHTAIEDIYEKIGDMTNSRFFTQDALANAANVDFEHNFKCPFADLRYDLYLRDTGTGELTLISDSSTPALSSFTIAATPSFTTTRIRVTNSSGASRNLALVLTQGVINSKKVDFVTKVVSGPVTLEEGKYHLVDTSAARSLTLPSPASTTKPIWLKDKTGSASTNPITLVRAGSEKIETVAASFVLDYDLGAWTLINDGTDWFVL
ncbi:MAG: hypothetical protein RLZZ74_3429 [Cyanobacteriota bacterium]|jgi:hypothetical protein